MSRRTVVTCGHSSLRLNANKSRQNYLNLSSLSQSVSGLPSLTCRAVERVFHVATWFGIQLLVSSPPLPPSKSPSAHGPNCFRSSIKHAYLLRLRIAKSAYTFSSLSLKILSRDSRNIYRVSLSCSSSYWWIQRVSMLGSPPLGTCRF